MDFNVGSSIHPHWLNHKIEVLALLNKKFRLKISTDFFKGHEDKNWRNTMNTKFEIIPDATMSFVTPQVLTVYLLLSSPAAVASGGGESEGSGSCTWHSRQQEQTARNKAWNSCLNILMFVVALPRKDLCPRLVSYSMGHADTQGGRRPSLYENLHRVGRHPTQKSWHFPTLFLTLHMKSGLPNPINSIPKNLLNSFF